MLHPGSLLRCGLLALLLGASGARILGAPASTATGEPIALTAAERAWLAQHPVVRVGYDPAWPPFSERAPDGRGVGIDADVLALVAQRLGVKFELVTRAKWTEVYDAAARGEIDMLAGTARTPEREKVFHFTAPYFVFPLVIVTRNDEPIVWSVLDLAGRRVAGVRNYAPTIELQRQYPTLDFSLRDTVEEAMKLVADGDADAFISNLPNVSFVAKVRGLANLKIAGVMPQTFDLCYAVRPDWPELVPILDRAIGSLTEAERLAIVHPWIRVDYAKVIRWDLVWKTSVVGLAIVGAVLGAFLFHNRKLAGELAERTRLQAEVERAHAELTHLMEEKTELMNMAAHDLRSPLTGITLSLDYLRAVPGDYATLERVAAATRQMRRLIDDLLDVQALEEGKRKFKREPVDVVAVVQEVIAAQEADAGRKKIRLAITEVAAGLPRAEADAGALRQVFDNLISNALKFSPPGRAVAITLRTWEVYVRVEIDDEGPGVPPDERERIFLKYARGSAHPTAGEKSTGLGLSIVRQLMTAMNGRVWCENRAAGGAFFVVVIPLAA